MADAGNLTLQKVQRDWCCGSSMKTDANGFTSVGHSRLGVGAGHLCGLRGQAGQ